MGKVAASSVDSLCLSQVHVDFEPWDNFVFGRVKMDVTPKKRAKLLLSMNTHCETMPLLLVWEN
jgi:hypothetical protein